MRDKTAQAWFNRRKVLVAAIRLKHSIAADNEINETVAAEKKRFDRALLKGKLPSAIEPQGALDAGYTDGA
jgi:hypothetical protein